MSSHEVVEIEDLSSTPQQDGGNTEGLTDGSTSASEQKEERWTMKDFKKRDCNTFIKDSSRDGWCQCGRPKDKHPKDIKTAEDTEWTTGQHSSEHPTDAFGELKFEGERMPRPFLRLSSDTEPSRVFDLMTRNVSDGGSGLGQPPLVVSVVGGDPLVVSVVGGEGSAEVKPWVQEVIREGLVKALNKGCCFPWILTEGFDEGVGRCVGEAVRDNPHVYVVGISPWAFVHDRDQLVNPQGRGHRNPAQYSLENKTCDSCYLEKNHDRFLLVDDGSERRRGGEKNLWVKLEEHIPTQHISTQHFRDSSSISIPVLCMLISGESSMLERVDLSLKNKTPWLVLAGSGGVANLLSDFLENQSHASAAVDVVRVTELVKKHFPSGSQTDQLVKQVRSIYQNRRLITFYHEEKDRTEDFDKVMIKALMPASKLRASGNTFPYAELILAKRWNRTQYTVRLFSEHVEHLTYGLLEKLYSTVDEKTLLYKLLVARLKERLGTSWKPDRHDLLKEISLVEVSGVLKEFMGEEKPFYFTALEHVRELGLVGEYRNKPCESPSSDLFIWAVLQNYSDMADIFWKKAEEPALNALSACKMLKEMSKLEYETETKHSMEKLSRKFEKLAHDVMGPCYQSDSEDSVKLLTRKSPVWGTDCIQMAMDAESRLFFNHDGFESLLSKIWWGPMMKDTTLWKFLLTLVCPLLLCTMSATGTSRPPGIGRLEYYCIKWYQFWSTSVTGFVSNAVMYILFLFLFAYVLLVDFKPPPPSGLSISEYILYFWVFTFLCEEIRQAFSVQSASLSRKLRLYWKDTWNRCDLIAIILFIIGLICRMFEWSYEFGRGVLCIDYMIFTLRIIHISTIHKGMGPKIIIVGKMMKDVISFLFFLGVWLMAYGVANQALLYPYDPNPLRIFRRVFYRPYLYIFGYLNLEEIDVGPGWNIACSVNMTEIVGGAEPCRSEFNNWLVIVLLVVFLLVTNILLINLLIAILSNTVNKVEENSNLYWSYQHYKLVTEYMDRPGFPPPFIIITHLCLFFSFLKKKFHWAVLKKKITKDQTDDVSLVESESDQDQEKVKNWEERVKNWEMEQKKNFLAAQSETERSSDSERIKQISEKMDNVLKQQSVDTVDRVSRSIQQMTDRVDRMEKQQQNQLKQLNEQLTETKDALGQILELLTKPSQHRAET